METVLFHQQSNQQHNNNLSPFFQKEKAGRSEIMKWSVVIGCRSAPSNEIQRSFRVVVGY
jgi:hypothetical protein